MAWVKATDSDGNEIYLNLSTARAIIPNESGGASVLFGIEDSFDVRESPRELFEQMPKSVSVAEIAKEVARRAR
jgi:hypothetical protein